MPCICATGSEQNFTVLLVVWAMRTVTPFRYFLVYRMPKAGYAGLSLLWEEFK
jgi:hypothetical protein